ncbi:hypothetical protein [Rubripirellula obstinata]|uniref:hypothetical protein n=1 Tax=Rubripirellula obstinata TaxID=406547 RepID=UPI001EE409E6|nr:hypothetical protein [Rubripirellula obstinata]
MNATNYREWKIGIWQKMETRSSLVSPVFSFFAHPAFAITKLFQNQTSADQIVSPKPTTW